MKQIALNSLKEILRSYKDKRILLTFHSIGDTDSVASAVALQKYFKNATIATPDFITSNSRRMLEHTGIGEKLIKKEFDANAELVILLDVNNFEDCGNFKSRLENHPRTILIIDHHTSTPMAKENVISFNDESYNSASSIVYEILKSSNINIDKRLATLLAAGILSDSAELRNSFPKTFVQLGELLGRAKMSYPSLLLEMQHIASPETREGFIEDLFKSNISISSGVLMLYGKSKFHANTTADNAIKIGADAAIFYSTNKKEVSFSTRLRPTLDSKYDIHLGRIMKELAPIIGGQGGGHPCAAGAYGPSIQNASKFLASFISVINNKVETARPNKK
jgi:nanoRNase/pAp phosphatase (c-di-AMP/oligoRNAs hydrolase)